MDDILNVKELYVSFHGYNGITEAIRGVSFQIQKGETYALMGESGSGKSVTAQSLLGLNPSPPAEISAQRLELNGMNILNASERELEDIRGSAAGMIFQDPLTCLNPTMKVWKQITERLYLQDHLSSSHCKKEAIRLLKQVQIPEAELRAEQYPHQLSGGMRQRVMIAMALAGSPKLLIADEPTTALDVTTQLQILKLITQIRKEMEMAILLITHDFGVVINLAERVGIMYAGKIVEEGNVKDLLNHPMHPYTKELITSISQQETAEYGGFSPERMQDSGIPLTGCAYANRCPDCSDICCKKDSPEFWSTQGHTASCWRLHDNTSKEKA